MAVARAMRRLLQVLEIEEEQAKLALESALGELRLLEVRWAAAVERSRGGRALVVLSARNGNLTDRWAGIEEARAATRHAALLKPRIVEAQLVVGARQKEYVAHRVERRQAETLIEEAEARDAVVTGRRNQQALDEWYLNRLHRIECEAVHSDSGSMRGRSQSFKGDRA